MGYTIIELGERGFVYIYIYTYSIRSPGDARETSETDCRYIICTLSPSQVAEGNGPKRARHRTPVQTPTHSHTRTRVYLAAAISTHRGWQHIGRFCGRL